MRKCISNNAKSPYKSLHAKYYTLNVQIGYIPNIFYVIRLRTICNKRKHVYRRRDKWKILYKRTERSSSTGSCWQFECTELCSNLRTYISGAVWARNRIVCYAELCICRLYGIDDSTFTVLLFATFCSLRTSSSKCFTSWPQIRWIRVHCGSSPLHHYIKLYIILKGFSILNDFRYWKTHFLCLTRWIWWIHLCVNRFPRYAN